MRLSLLPFLIFLSNSVYSQTTVHDSLRSFNETTLSDSAKVVYLNNRAREFIFISISKSTEYAQEALELSLKLKYKRGEATAYRNLASVYAVQEYFNASSRFIEKSIALFKELKDSVGLGNCYLTLGYSYSRQHEFQKAKDYHIKALKIFELKNMKSRQAAALHNLSESQLLSGDLTSAKINNQKAIEIFKKKIDLPSLTVCYTAMGVIYFKENKIDSAKAYFEDALNISAKLGKSAQKNATIDAMVYLAKIHRRHGNFHKEEALLRQAIRISKENKYSMHLREAYLNMVDFQIRNKNFNAAQTLLKEYSIINDSLVNIQNRDKAAMAESLMLRLQVASKNEQLQQQKDLQEQIIQSQKTKLTAYTLFTIALFLLLGGLFYIYQQNKSLSETLVIQNKIIEEKSSKLTELNTSKDKFFGLIAHDIKSPLNSLQSFVTLLEEDYATFSKDEITYWLKELNHKLSDTISLADNLIIWAQSQMQSAQTNPDSVVLKEIVDDSVRLYKEIMEQKKINLTINVPDDLTVYADHNHIEFIVRNLLNNALKFTPKHGTISVSAHPNTTVCTLIIEDSGQGIKPEILYNLFTLEKSISTLGTEGEKGTGLGLILCKEFTEKNGGQILVESKLGYGTRFSVMLPSHKDEPTQNS